METFLLWLGQNAVKGSVVTVIVFFALLFFSRKIPPRYRYVLWYLAAIRFVMLPVFFASFSFFALAPSLIPEKLPATKEFNIEQEAEFNSKQEVNMYPASSVSNYIESEKSWSSVIQENISVILFAVWAIGAFGLISLFILRNIWGSSLTKGLTPIEDKKINVFIDECRELVNVNRKFILHETELTGSPVLLGVFKPKLLIPKKLFDKLKAHELRYVILHELMHLKKNDILINWFFGIACALQWFNPFVWYAFARMKSDREEARDADVLALLNRNESKEYGGLILKLSTLCGSGASFSESVGIMEKNNKITRRIIMIKNFHIMPLRNTILAVALIAGVGIFCLSEAKSKEASKTIKSEIQKKFQAMKINKIIIKRGKIKNAITYLSSRFKEHYPQTKVKFILSSEDKERVIPGITLDSTAVGGNDFEYILKSFCNFTGLQYRIENNTVVLYDTNFIKAFESNDSKVRINAIQQLSHIVPIGKIQKKMAVTLLTKALKDKDSTVRSSAATGLGNIANFPGRKKDKILQDIIFKALINALKDKDSDVRKNIANALGKMKDKRAIELLIAALKDKKNKHMHISILRALAKLKDKRAAEPLVKLLKDDNSRLAAVQSLAILGDKRAFEPAIRFLKSKNFYTRLVAIKALRKLQDKRAIEPLINALKDKEKNVRIYAASVLGDLKDKRAIQPLKELLKTEKNPYAIKAIKGSLKILTEEPSKLSGKDKDVVQLIKNN